jgi:arylsulfatase A-like enzyme
MSDESARKRVMATITNTILRVDVGMGLLLDELKVAGLVDNTLVVFMGDSGLPGTHGKATSYKPRLHCPDAGALAWHGQRPPKTSPTNAPRHCPGELLTSHWEPRYNTCVPSAT